MHPPPGTRWQIFKIEGMRLPIRIPIACLALPVSFLLTGCSHYYYCPPMQNVPLFKEKNEVRAAGSLGGGDEISTYDFQAAYSCTDKFAVVLNYMGAWGGNRDDKNWGRGDYVDAGIGYFKPLNDFCIFETFGGLGGSYQYHEYSSSSTSFSGNTEYFYGQSDLVFSAVYLQPSIGITFNAFDVILAARASNVYFHRVRSEIDEGSAEYGNINMLSMNRNAVLVEPSLTLRGGWKYVKLQVQVVSSYNLAHPDLAFEDGKISLGLSFLFAERFWR